MGNKYIQKIPSQPMMIQPLQQKKNGAKSQVNSFSQHLKQAEEKQSNLTISKHAGHRMHQRQIDIESHVWEKIGTKVDEAKQKGINDSLVLLNNAALIINAKNSTVITVMDRQEASKQIFTNIDGTIIMD